jgi:Protein of unknown function (DUF5672)
LLDLPDVTLVALFGIEHELTLMAVDECLKRVRFGDVKLFTDNSMGRRAVDARWATVQEGARFATYAVPCYIKTSHTLWIHWDSWVLDERAWTDDFLRYDYVGAPWWFQTGNNVGNSGFTIRSKRLMEFIAANEAAFPIGSPEDIVLCREYAPRLPQFRWAPEALAHKFAFERVRREQFTFGYHGLWNWVHVLTDMEIHQRLAKATPYAMSRVEYPELLALMAYRAQNPTKFYLPR